MNKEPKSPEIGELYSFIDLQAALNNEKAGTFYHIEQLRPAFKAIMHVFAGNFSDDYKSGDAVIFYSDGDVCSADDSDEFRLLKIIHPSTL